MISIPRYAKTAARKGLAIRMKLKKSEQFGLTKTEADAIGIASGVERAKQIINNKYMNTDDAMRVARFYARWRNQSSKKIEGAILIWGGRRWGKELYHTFYGGNS
jgi:hypothetical protein